MTTASKDSTALDPRDAPVHQKLHADKGVTIAEVATALGMGRSTVTKAMRRLEEAGLAVRAKGGRDGSKRLPDVFTLPPSTEPDNKAGKSKHGKVAKKSATKLVSPATAKDGRLAKGELERLVRTFLTDHPHVEFGPSQLAKELDKSAGAIANILVKMTGNGLAELVQDKPKRYRITATGKAGGRK